MSVHDPKVLRARLEELATKLPFEVTTRQMMGGLYRVSRRPNIRLDLHRRTSESVGQPSLFAHGDTEFWSEGRARRSGASCLTRASLA
jgi:hypothetical protein